jgi:hypothetical protein
MSYRQHEIGNVFDGVRGGEVGGADAKHCSSYRGSFVRPCFFTMVSIQYLNHILMSDPSPSPLLSCLSFFPHVPPFWPLPSISRLISTCMPPMVSFLSASVCRRLVLRGRGPAMPCR